MDGKGHTLYLASRLPYCVVRADPSIPEPDHVLTVFLSLMTDERRVLEVVKAHNVFLPYSDHSLRETILPTWQPRLVA